MKFMINWQLHEGKLHDTLAMFAQMDEHQEKSMMGDQVQLIGRWHDLVRGQGVAIFESESAAALSAYAMNWNQHMDLDISVVTDDEEARAIGQNLMSAMAT